MNRTRGPQPGVARSTHHRRQRNPARSGGKSHSGTSARSGEGPTTAHTNHTHTHTSSKPQPAPATQPHTHTHTSTHTEDTPTPTPPRTHDTHTSTDTTRARTAPQTHTPAANHSQGRWGHAHKQHGQQKPKAPPTTTTPPGRDGKPTTENHTAKRGVGREGRTGDAGEGPNLRGLGAPPVTVSAPPEDTQ